MVISLNYLAKSNHLSSRQSESAARAQRECTAASLRGELIETDKPIEIHRHRQTHTLTD